MAPITSSIEIARPPEEVFAYLDDLSRHGEWQHEIERVTLETDGPVRVGTRAREQRKVPGGSREFTYEITEHDPPRRLQFRVVEGPVRPVGTVTVAPLDDGTRSRVSIELDFKGYGLGKMLLPLVLRDAAKRVPANQRHLKERLESGAAGTSAGSP